MDNELLLRRVERVERENRYLKLAGLLLLVFVATAGAIQQDTPARIDAKLKAEIQAMESRRSLTCGLLTAQKIVITDEQGNNRGMLSVDKDGGYLLFQDGGRAAMKLGLVGDEPHLDTPDIASRTGWRNWLGKARVIPAR